MNRPERRRRCSGFQDQQERLREQGRGSGDRTPPRTPRAAEGFAPPCLRRRRRCSALLPRGPWSSRVRAEAWRALASGSGRPLCCEPTLGYSGPQSVLQGPDALVLHVTMAHLHLFIYLFIFRDGLPVVRVLRSNNICFFRFKNLLGRHTE